MPEKWKCEVCGETTDRYCAGCFNRLCDKHMGDGDSYPGEWCQECLDETLKRLEAGVQT